MLIAVERYNVIRAIRGLPNGGIISRETLCKLIHVDPAPLSSPDPIIRDSFVQWFHRYLRLLRRAIIDAGIPTLLEYPDRENDDGEPTGGGLGIALLKMDGATAGAFILLKCARENEALTKRHAKRMVMMLADDSAFMPTARRKRDAIRAVMNGMLQMTRGSLAITKQSVATALQELPSLDPYFNTVLETVITPESTDDE